ncbi:hypothetical protein UY3_15440 [Chelonia mydas]|uniref:Uncharacterized protein n=1 Tax=Chelonia mydas TaxID=8469 RepID=M7AWQ5_CHEMY|nr:hypothetical protein UY3_15440 [Chelonia mydas]
MESMEERWHVNKTSGDWRNYSSRVHEQLDTCRGTQKMCSAVVYLKTGLEFSYSYSTFIFVSVSSRIDVIMEMQEDVIIFLIAPEERKGHVSLIDVWDYLADKVYSAGKSMLIQINSPGLSPVPPFVSIQVLQPNHGLDLTIHQPRKRVKEGYENEGVGSLPYRS